jgi:hypothetical protein
MIRDVERFTWSRRHFWLADVLWASAVAYRDRVLRVSEWLVRRGHKLAARR